MRLNVSVLQSGMRFVVKSMEISVLAIDFISEALEQVEARTAIFKPEITLASFICQVNYWRFSERYYDLSFFACNRITLITTTRQ